MFLAPRLRRCRVFHKTVDHALHLHETRAFHQHGGVGRECVFEFGKQFLDTFEMHCTGAESPDGFLRQFAQGQQPVHPRRARRQPDLCMHRRGVAT